MKFTRQERYDIYAQAYDLFDAKTEMFICHAIGKIAYGRISKMEIDDFPELKFVAPRRFYHGSTTMRKEWVGPAFCVNDEEPYFDKTEDLIEYNAFWEDIDNYIVAGNEKTWRLTMLAFMMELCVQDDLDEWTP